MRKTLNIMVKYTIKDNTIKDNKEDTIPYTELDNIERIFQNNSDFEDVEVFIIKYS